jgi:hypothetical protein
MGDSDFTDGQLVAWYAAEADLNISNKPGGDKGKKQGTRHMQWLEGEDFVRATTFWGGHEGFVYKKGDLGMGYYRAQPAKVTTSKPEALVLDVLISVTRCTPALMEGEAVHVRGTKGRARRARFPDGRRKPAKSRKKRASESVGKIDLQDTGICPLIGKVEVENQWWAKLGMFALETSNGNSWQSLNSAVVQRSKADVLFGQETKLTSDEAILVAERTARKAGWNPTLTKAHQAAVHFGSGGGAILARGGTGITPIGAGIIPEAAAHRLNIARVDAVVKGC